MAMSMSMPRYAHVAGFTLFQEVRITGRKLAIMHSRGHSPLALVSRIKRAKHDRTAKNRNDNEQDDDDAEKQM